MKQAAEAALLSALPIDMPLDVLHETGMTHAPEEEVLDQVA